VYAGNTAGRWCAVVLWVVGVAPACEGGDAPDSDADTSSTSASSSDATADATSNATVDATVDATSDTTSETLGDSTGAPPGAFEPFACVARSPDVLTDRLCDEAADPENAPDEVFITCALEGSCAGPEAPAPRDALVVMAYNVERGYHVDEHVALMLAGDVLPMPDVLLLSEVDRGCARTDARNVAWDYAEGLGMNHVYGVEFVELPRPGEDITAPCEHGNAILSRYPIGNVELVRHATNKSWYDVEGEPRLGGRMAVVADILVGDRLLQVHSLHFESGILDGPIRAAQAAELADLALARGTPAVIGGDTNAGGYVLDLVNGTQNDATTQAFFTRGFLDTHADLPATDRATHEPGLVLDIMFTSGPVASAPVVCPEADCVGLSDHLPIWATITLP
jgi:endonuclease/exonuclease/phosphatase family metal-dependent hydrolase